MDDLSEKVAAVLPVQERAWAAVNLALRGKVKRQKNGCWYYMGYRQANSRKNRRGYGRVWVGGRAQPAHRIAYEAVNDPIEPGWHVHHLCGNRPCVNPAHLDQLMPHLNNLERTLRNGWRPCLHPNPRRNPHGDCVDCRRAYDRRPDVRARQNAARRTPERRASNTEYKRRWRARRRLYRNALESALRALAFQS